MGLISQLSTNVLITQRGIKMVQITVKDIDGGETQVTSDVGSSLMEVIRDSGHENLMAICGGTLSCATCHVYITPSYLDRLPDIVEMEDELLDCSDYRKDNSRLSCQIHISEELAGITVEIAPEE